MKSMVLQIQAKSAMTGTTSTTARLRADAGKDFVPVDGDNEKVFQSWSPDQIADPLLQRDGSDADGLQYIGARSCILLL